MHERGPQVPGQVVDVGDGATHLRLPGVPVGVHHAGRDDAAGRVDDDRPGVRQVPADLINIIEYNPIEFAQFKKPTEEKTNAFMAYLDKHKVNARLRRSRGKDIDAACGQLANK